MEKLDKAGLVRAIVAHLENEKAVLAQVAKAAHESATHEESRAEDRHDTMGIEASYLAGAQNVRVAQIERTLTYFRSLTPKELVHLTEISMCALITLESRGKKTNYFFAAQGGGNTIQFEGQQIQILTAQSPLGEELFGKRQGDVVEVEANEILREYKILALD